MQAIRYLLIITLITLGVALTAARANAANAPQQNRYRVEMVFFTFNNPNNFNQEDWRQGLPQPDLAHALNLFGGQSSPGFKVLPPSAYQLDAAARRLQASGRYTVIAHLAWEQPGLDVNQAVPIAITAGADYGPLYPQLMQPRFVVRNGQAVEIPAPQHLYQLYGTVKIVLSRYLHLYTDLVLRVPTKPENMPATAQSGQTASPASNQSGAGLAQSTTGTQPDAVQSVQTKLVEDMPVILDPQHAQPASDGTLTEVHIIEHRRTRSRLLNYVDHPLVGILFEIWPIGNSR